MTETKKIHTFERAGLGVAPFRVVGFGVETYQACQGAPVQPGSSCDYCGTGIMNVFRIRGADGRVFKVGADCVRKTGDAGLRRDIDATKRAHERELRQARKVKLEATLRSDVETRCAAILARLDTLGGASDAYAASVARDMAKQLRAGRCRDLSPAQLDFVTRLETKVAAR